MGIGVGVLIGRATVDEPQPVLYGLPSGGNASEAPGMQAEPVRVATEGRPARGPDDAEVTMVEFVDFECPFCGNYARDTFPRVMSEYGDRVRYVSRHFPLDSHPHAADAAAAAECAHAQGRYWQLHERLFANQEQLGKRGLAAQARRAGLDMQRYSACLDAPTTLGRIQTDVDDGRRYGVTGTPTFFVDGKIIRGAQPYEQIKAELDSALRG